MIGSGRALVVLIAALSIGTVVCAQERLAPQGEQKVGGWALGRLLLTPKQRRALERERRQQADPQDQWRVDGLVVREDGQQWLWINGSLQRAVPAHRLRVGERWDRRTGAREDVLPDGAVRIVNPGQTREQLDHGTRR